MTYVPPGGDASASERGSLVVTVTFSPEELALLQASVAFHARHVTDPLLRERLERAAARLFTALRPARAA